MRVKYIWKNFFAGSISSQVRQLVFALAEQNALLPSLLYAERLREELGLSRATAMNVQPLRTSPTATVC